MPYQSEFGSNGIYTKFYGCIHADEIDEAGQRVRNHRLTVGYIDYCICNFLDVEELAVTDFEILMLAAQDHHAIDINPALRIAIVAADARIAGILRLYADSPLMRRNARVFGTLAAAYAWVDSARAGSAGTAGRTGACAA